MLQTKEHCYPSGVVVFLRFAEVKLQSLIDHMVRILVSAQYDVVNQYLGTINNIITSPLTLIFKWGCDRSSGHSRYKQKWAEQQDMHDNDDASYTFAVYMVSILLFATNKAGDNVGNTWRQNLKGINWDFYIICLLHLWCKANTTEYARADKKEGHT